MRLLSNIAKNIWGKRLEVGGNGADQLYTEFKHAGFGKKLNSD